jgi:hypothetical protein
VERGVDAVNNGAGLYTRSPCFRLASRLGQKFNPSDSVFFARPILISTTPLIPLIGFLAVHDVVDFHVLKPWKHKPNFCSQHFSYIVSTLHINQSKDFWCFDKELVTLSSNLLVMQQIVTGDAHPSDLRAVRVSERRSVKVLMSAAQ